MSKYCLKLFLEPHRDCDDDIGYWRVIVSENMSINGVEEYFFKAMVVKRRKGKKLDKDRRKVRTKHYSG